MAGPITNGIRNILSLNDDYITYPLFENQKRPWIGIFPAALQVVTSTITIVAAGIFALLASALGLICKGVGFEAAGEDLLKSARLAVFNVAPTGAVFHLLMAIISLINTISLTKFAQSANISLERPT